MRTRVKFCGLVRSEDICIAQSLGVDAIGFVFYPKSPRALTVDDAVTLRKSVGSWVKVVGLFVNESSQEIAQIANQVGLDIVQLHGDETTEQAAQIAAACGLPWWRAARCQTQGDLLRCVNQFDQANAWLLDSFSPLYGGTGHQFDWSILEGIALEKRQKMILSGGLTAQTVGQAIAQFQVQGVDVSSAIEGEHRRTKSPQKMAEFMQAVVLADAATVTG
jgi:phosphoribosylanthranilate isomerase